MGCSSTCYSCSLRLECRFCRFLDSDPDSRFASDSDSDERPDQRQGELRHTTMQGDNSKLPAANPVERELEALRRYLALFPPIYVVEI
jgi:hypothetical protein